MSFRGARADKPRVVNLANSALGWAGRWLPIRSDALVRRAVAKVPGAAPEQLRFREELDLLCRGLEEEAELSFVGRFAARDDTLRLVETQLRIQRALLAREGQPGPELLPPVFILGWLRTGTTRLLNLLALDPANRALPYYESFDPVPPAPGETDRRIERLDAMLRTLAWFSPRYQAIHAMTAEAPEECVALFMNAFRTLQLDIQYRVPSYARHLLESSPEPAYRFYREQLRLVQAARPGGERWLLKDPTHLFALDVLIELFPDARFVFTHRDPAEVFGSICSLYAHTRAIFSDAVDPRALGREILEGYWPDAMRRALEVRRAHPERRFADVHYGSLVRDPMGALEKLYADLGLPFSSEAHHALQQALATEAAEHAEPHRYALEDYGLQPEEVRERCPDPEWEAGRDL